jgi:hypothetical protein
MIPCMLLPSFQNRKAPSVEQRNRSKHQKPDNVHGDRLPFDSVNRVVPSHHVFVINIIDHTGLRGRFYLSNREGKGDISMAPFQALLGFLDRLSPAATHESKFASPLKSSLRKPVESLAPGTVQPVVTKKTVRMSLPAPVADTRRYRDFDYRQTRGVSQSESVLAPALDELAMQRFPHSTPRQSGNRSQLDIRLHLPRLLRRTGTTTPFELNSPDQVTGRPALSFGR